MAILKELPPNDGLAQQAAQSLLELGGSLGLLFLWDEAMSALGPGLERASHPVDGYVMFQAFFALVRHDQEGYRRACRQIIDVSGKSEDGHFLANAALISALAPDSGIDAAIYLPLGELGVKNTDHDSILWRHAYLAHAYFRAGRLNDALKQLEIVEKGVSLDDEAWGGTIVQTRAIRAMTFHRLGRFAESRQALNEAVKWHSALFNRVLSRPTTNLPVGDYYGLIIASITLEEACARSRRRAAPRISVVRYP